MREREDRGARRAFGRGMARAVLALALAAASAAAQEGEPGWSGSLGLSFVATSGNADTSTLGLDLKLEREPAPWGWKATAFYLTSESEGETTAERYGGALRGERAVGERWRVFAGVSGDHDAFAGYDLRGMVEAGATYRALLGPVHELAFDGGLTWTSEDLIGAEDRDFLGGVLGLAYAWHPREGTVLGERLVWYPDFDETSGWRLTSETSFQAALTDRLAVKVGYLVRYDNEPVPGFDDTDTITTVSLVVGF